jgi:hypothetical protein
MTIKPWLMILVATVVIVGVLNAIWMAIKDMGYERFLIMTVALCGWAVVIGLISHVAKNWNKN